MFCRQCGKPIDDGQELCEDCKNVANVNSSANTNTNANMNNGTNPTVNVNVNTGYTNPNPNASQKSKIAGGLLGIFLGGLGVHNFYLGYTGKAVAQLLISLLSCGFLAWASAIWGLIEGILILTGSISVDGNGNPLKD
jgi:TM2 domain-containing membrane protein YozV